ncbi:anaphase-promoting complex subunit 15B-like [Daphnia carinata]|uniref:anaphase-promoting complex subunit 15B-like n=1 Tax=Daphnia carinata TaxID=120202 RepID=UPI0028685C99|nr:anaphase-promoting complex subunit 15B-like [Daphnia carinata]
MWLNSVATKNSDMLPIGKTSSEPVDEDEDEEDEEEHEDDDSESREDDDSESREAEDSDIDSFTVNGPNFNRDLGEGPPRLANLTMDLSE